MKLRVFTLTEIGPLTYEPGVHEVTPALAESFYVRGTGRPATMAEIAEDEQGRPPPAPVFEVPRPRDEAGRKTRRHLRPETAALHPAHESAA